MVRDVVTEMVGTSLSGAAPPSPVAAPAATPAVSAANGPVNGPVNGSGRHRAETVRIESDADLDAFVRHLLALFENPKNRQDVRAGRHTFRLAAPASSAGAQGRPTVSAYRIEKGAVTERHIKAIAESGQRLVLGRAAVLTPLARERARALGVAIEKEH
jgi:hypothetical protein